MLNTILYKNEMWQINLISLIDISYKMYVVCKMLLYLTVFMWFTKLFTV